MPKKKLDVSGSKAEEKPKKKKRRSSSKLDTPKKREDKKKKEKKRKKKVERLKESTELAVVEQHELLIGEVVGVGNEEQEYMEEYRRMFHKLQHMCGKFEDRMEDNPQSKDVYALMNMYSQLRECINDMRLIKDTGAQAEHLAHAVLEPLLKSIGECLVNVYFKTVSAVRESAPEHVVADLLEKLKEINAEQAGEAQKAYESAKARLHEEMAPGGK